MNKELLQALREFRERDDELDIEHQWIVDHLENVNLKKRTETINSSDLDVLSLISERPIALKEIVSNVSMTQGAVSKIISKLEKKGLIERIKRPTNQKAIYLLLTTDGIELKKVHQQMHLDLDRKYEQLEDEFTPEQLAVILEFIQKVNHLRYDIK